MAIFTYYGLKVSANFINRIRLKTVTQPANHTVVKIGGWILLWKVEVVGDYSNNFSKYGTRILTLYNIVGR